MMSKQDIEQLPLPPFYLRNLKQTTILISTFLLISIALFSFVLDAITNIHAIKQSLSLSISSIIISIIFMQEEGITKERFKEHLLSPVFISVLSLSLLIGLNIPCYSLVTTSIFIIILIKISRNWTQKLRYQKEDGIWITLITFFLNLICLKQEGYITFSWKIILIIPALFLLFGFIIMNVVYFYQYQDEQKKINRIYNHCEITLLTFLFILNPLVLDLLVCALWPYLSSRQKINIALSVLSLNILADLIFLVFKEQITLLNCFEKYTERGTIFKVHQRCYKKTYQTDCCQRNIKWKNQDCLLCNQQARVVYFDCGHLALCNDCKYKFSSKKYRKCVICGQEYAHCRLLQKEENPKRQGYQRKLFIQKKLRRNQFKAL